MNFQIKQRFSIRTYAIGAASVLLGLAFLTGPQVSADQLTESSQAAVVTEGEILGQNAEASKVEEEELVMHEEVVLSNETPLMPLETEAESLDNDGAESSQPNSQLDRQPNLVPSLEGFEEEVPEMVEETEIASSLLGDNYPWKHQAMNAGITDDWGYPIRYCTSFVAFRLGRANGASNFSYLGNAGDWGRTAASRGFKVDQQPSVGAVAYFKPWVGGAHGLGHVSWVADVKGDQVVLEEYNFNTIGGYHTRTIHKSEASGYIHLKDLGVSTASTVTPKPTSTSVTLPSNGNYTFKERASIKAEPKMAAAELAYYSAGQSVNYDSVVEADGKRWISYLSYAGNRRYIAVESLPSATTGSVAPKANTGNILVFNNNKTAGTFDVLISNVYSQSGVTQVQVPVWSEKQGQDDIVWYTANKITDTLYKISVDSKNHNNDSGTYHIHLYYLQGDGKQVGVGGTTTTVAKTSTIPTKTIPSSGTYTFTGYAAIRSQPNVTSPELAHYDAGYSVYYDQVLVANGHQWISYLSYSGARRYIAIT